MALTKKIRGYVYFVSFHNKLPSSLWFQTSWHCNVKDRCFKKGNAKDSYEAR